MEFRLLGVALILAPVIAFAAESEQEVKLPPLGVMQRAYLQDSTPYVVGIGSVATTIMLPGPIEAFEGTNITTQPNTLAAAYLQHTQGTTFFSVKAILPGVSDLNVILNGAIYSFRFIPSDAPTRSLVISPVPSPAAAAKARTLRLSAERLYQIVQEAKTYFVIQEQHPELQRPIEVTKPGTIIPLRECTVVLDQIFRFDRDDTLVFRVVFLNDQPTPLTYSPGEIALRAGKNLYWPSFAQLSGNIPPLQPATLSFELSPDITKLELTKPDGSTSEIRQTTQRLTETGAYVLTASDAAGKTDRVKFAVKYPVPPNEALPLVVGDDPKGFGIRKLTLAHPYPGQSFGYICYSGTADGQRAELSLDQNFALLFKPTPASP